MKQLRRLAVATAVSLLAACATPKEPPTTASEAAKSKDGDVVFASTYKPYPGLLTAITGATIFDGEGGRIDNGTLVIADGVVRAIGGPDTAVPEGAVRIDAAGEWVTPGIIDVHSHLGDYPSPGVAAHDDGNETTSPVRPEVWAEHSVWPHDPGFSRALTNGGVTGCRSCPDRPICSAADRSR